MIIYKDKLNGDELFTDAVYNMQDLDVYIKFTAKLTSRTDKIDDSKIGGNASAEEQQEQAEDASQTGLDFALTSKLIEGALSSKKDFQGYFKGYFKKLQDLLIPPAPEGTEYEGEAKEKYDSQTKEFKKRAMAYFNIILESHKDLCCYYGESDYACENNSCFVKWLDDKNVEVYVFKDGLDQEKY